MKKRDLIRLLAKALIWDTEQHKYVCLDCRGEVIFTNDLDSNGYRHFTKGSLLNVAARMLETPNE